MQILLWIVLMTLLNGLIAFSGIFYFFIPKRLIERTTLFLVAIATGSLLGGAFFHFIPESIGNLKIQIIGLLVVLGFLIFYCVEKMLHWHHCHREEGKCKHPMGYLILYGDAVHNFIDGVIISGSFLVSVPFGIITSFIIISHELPQEIGDFGVLVYSGFSRVKALLYNFFSQLTSVLGGVLGFYFLQIHEITAGLMPLAAGGFLYIAVMDLIPEVFRERNIKKVIINSIAIAIGLLVLLSAKLFVG